MTTLFRITRPTVCACLSRELRFGEGPGASSTILLYNVVRSPTMLHIDHQRAQLQGANEANGRKRRVECALPPFTHTLSWYTLSPRSH